MGSITKIAVIGTTIIVIGKSLTSFEPQWDEESKKPQENFPRLTTRNQEVVVNTNWGRTGGARDLINGLNESTNQTNKNPIKKFYFTINHKNHRMWFWSKNPERAPGKWVY